MQVPVILVFLLFPAVHGFCFKSFGRIDKTVTGRLIPVCEYNGLDILDGSTFTTAACTLCTCKKGHLSCCGYGVNAGESKPPPGCVVIADGCDAIYVREINKTVDCLTGRPIHSHAPTTDATFPSLFPDVFPGFFVEGGARRGIPIDMNMLTVQNSGPTPSATSSVTGSGSVSLPGMGQQSRGDSQSGVLPDLTSVLQTTSLTGGPHDLTNTLGSGLQATQGVGSLRDPRNLLNTLGTGLQQTARGSGILDHGALSLLDQLLSNSSAPWLWDGLLNDLLTGYTSQSATAMDSGSPTHNPTTFVNTLSGGGQQQRSSGVVDNTQQGPPNDNNLLRNLLLYKGLTELK